MKNKIISESLPANDKVYIAGVKKGCIDGEHSNFEIGAFKSLDYFKAWLEQMILERGTVETILKELSDTCEARFSTKNKFFLAKTESNKYLYID